MNPIRLDADLLDDLGASPRDLLNGMWRMEQFTRTDGSLWSIVDLSEVNAAAIADAMRVRPRHRLPSFHESRGDFAKALEASLASPIARSRLLWRMGRHEEARSTFTAEDVATLLENGEPNRQAVLEFRPLEDAES